MHFSKIKESLHDAILKSIELEWESGETVAKFILNEVNSIGGQMFFILCIDVSNIQIPRHFEWGQSNSVNNVWIDENNTFKIQMQSGDMIIIAGKNYFSNGSENLIIATL